MKIALIKPTIGTHEHSLYIDEGRMEPLMLGILAALTPEDIEVELYDDRMEDMPYDHTFDLVAITVETYTARRSYEIAHEFRSKGIKVIMGGIHVMLIPQEVEQHCDSMLIGDAETIWATIIEDLRNNQLKKRYYAKPGIAQIGGIQPRRSLYVGKGYLPVSLIQFSRGCQYSCTFCAVSSYFDKKHYIRDIDEVLREIEEQKLKFLFFVDDNIASDHKALKDLARELIPMKINWISQASIDMTRDPELMKLVADSGCMGNVIGFESIVPQSLRGANKHFNLKNFNTYQEEIAVLKEFGMQTWAAFTLGYDSDTLDTISATREFAYKNKFTFAAFNILMPYPGTPLYTRLQEEGRLLYGGKWWLHPEYRFNAAAFVPAQMSPDALTDACHEARTKFNSIPSLLYRFSDIKTNLRSLWRATAFIRYASLFRKEVHKKHKMRFGYKFRS